MKAAAIFLLAASWSSLVPGGVASEDGDLVAKPCCLPETWHGFVKIIFGKVERRRRAKAGMVTTEMFVDGDRKRSAGRVSTGVTRADFTFLGFFDEQSGRGFRFYAYQTYNATTCWTYRWDKFEYQKPCLPENANFKGSYKVGPKNNGLPIDAWGLNEARPGFSFGAEVLVTQDGCLPVALREIGSAGFFPFEDEDYDDDRSKKRFPFTTQPTFSPKAKSKPSGKKFVVGALYNDIELQIEDDQVFDLPDVCRANLRRYPPKPEDITDPETEEGLENMAAILERVLV